MSYKTAFKSDLYKPQTEDRLYTAQVFNPGIGNDGNAKPWGFGFEKVYADLIGFTGIPDEGWICHEDYQFKDKEEIKPVYVNPNPRLIMVRRGDVRFMESATKADLGFLRGHPRNEDYRQNRAAYKVYTRNLVYFVGEDNRLLHHQPLSLRLGGAAAGTFADAWGKRNWSTGQLVGGFQFDLLNAYWEDLGEEPQAMGDAFFAYWVFGIQCKAQSKGEKGASNLVCCTVSYDVPTPANLEDLYINPESADGQLITQALDRYPNYGKQTAAPSQPQAAPEDEDLPSVAVDGKLIQAKYQDHPEKGLLALFGIQVAGGGTQNCCAIGTVAQLMQQLYHDGSYVSLSAIATFDRKGNPLLKVTQIAASVPPDLPDLSDLLATIDIEIARLGWSKRQGSAYLQKTYGKKTRSTLSDTELQAFATYLQQQAPPYRP